jgi:hypothetical protein
MKLIYFFTKKKERALKEELGKEIRTEVRRQIQSELSYYRSNLAPTKIRLKTKDFDINVNIALLIVNRARQKFKQCWHVEEALDIILSAFKDMPAVVALDLLLGKVAVTVDLPNNKVVLATIEDHPEFELSEDIKKELSDSKVVTLNSFIKYLKMQWVP